MHCLIDLSKITAQLPGGPSSMSVTTAEKGPLMAHESSSARCSKRLLRPGFGHCNPSYYLNRGKQVEQVPRKATIVWR